MTIAHVMKNTGSKPIETNVYNHNFTTIDKQPTGPDFEITVPWQITGAAGRGGRGRQGALPARRLHPPPGPSRRLNPYAPLAAGERMGTQCGQPQMQALAEPARQQARVLEGARRLRVLPGQLHRLWRGRERQRHPYREQEDGRGRAHHGRSAGDAVRLLVDPDGRRAGALHRPQHRAGPAVQLDVHVRLLHNEVGGTKTQTIYNIWRTWSAIVFASVFAFAASAAAQSESAGVNQYFNNCASCHESNDPGHQAPKTGVLKQMTPEHILDVMTTGSMRYMLAASATRTNGSSPNGSVAGRSTPTCRRDREDAERLRHSSSGARVECAGLERLGRDYRNSGSSLRLPPG